MLQAMNTGHDGSITTCHANSARDALARIETMVLMAVPNYPQEPSGADILGSEFDSPSEPVKGRNP